MELPDAGSLARALRRPRNRVLLALAALALLARIALPELLRAVLVSEADAALVGRIALADLDLSLLRGGVTLHGLEVHVDELPAPGAEGAAPAPAAAPLFEARRLWTQIRWLALFDKTIELEEFELEGFALRLDRLADGLLLPKPVQGDAAPAPEPADSEPLGLSYAAERIALRDGRVLFRDHTVGAEPQHFELALEDLSAQQLALRVEPREAETGRIALQAQLGEGSIALAAEVAQHPGGPGAHTRLRLAKLPIGDLRVYLTRFGWSALEGTLDAEIEHRFEPGGVHALGGTASLSDLAIRVPALERPALGFARLAVALDELDLAQQRAVVSELALVGARVAVAAGTETPVLALAAREAPEAAAAQESAEPARPWSWSVRSARVEDAVIELLGGAEPLPIALAAQLGPLSGEPGSRWPLALSLERGQGTLGVEGALGISPIAFEGKLALAQLALPELLARFDLPNAGLLRDGTARAELSIALAEDLRVEGTLGLAGLALGLPESEAEFALAWSDLELGIQELSLPDPLGAREAAGARAIALKLERVQLVEPSLALTRTAQGLVLPPLARAEGAGSEAEAPAAELAIEVASVQIERARAQLSDRAVEPVFASAIESLDLRARGLRWPGPSAEDLALRIAGLEGATLELRGSLAPARSRLRAVLEGLPLAAINSYVSPTGYELADGSLSLESSGTLAEQAYETRTDVVVSQLDIGGAQGASRFQETFGLPLSVAVALLEDLDGKIALSIPASGDREGVKVGLRAIAAQALRGALVGALASPLKLLGAVTANGVVQRLAPEPIAFAPGSAELGPGAAARLAQLGRLLARSPGIALTLTGGVAEADLRILRERALLAELEASSGLGALAGLGEIGTRNAVREHLAARLAGAEPGALASEQQAWLEAHARAIRLDPTALAALARARAAALRDALVREHGVSEARLALAAPASDPPVAQPGVAIALEVARRPAAQGR